ncbi:ABC transporter substrate-binding protein [Lutibacter citreus]|uniref:ABC transporter substrate-binding protein n=1 Tax=Lutibacter citreus TaxID=2138210 RepID=UPI000DBE49EB|nr:ABC transporter substrate-binding protein [Lutibacter citreus]
MSYKIALLLPRSDMFPSLALDFLNGLKQVLNSTNNNNIFPNLIIEGIGNATNDSLLRIAEKMILQENVDLTISFCGINHLKELTNIFNSYKKPLIHIDLGGHMLKKEHLSSYVLHHTLNLCQSSYQSGIYAAKKFGKNAALAISIYDGGYHLSQSFIKGFTENGGNIVYTYVSPMDYKSETFETMIKGIEESNPDVVFSLFSYKEGIKVFEAFAKSGLNGKIPLLTIPLMADETINTKNYEIEDVYSLASWAFDEESLEMKNFIENYKKLYQEKPNIISLLGFEVGLTIIKSINTDGRIPLKIAKHLKLKTITTPRGKLTYNNFNESQLTQFKLRKLEYHKTSYHNTVIETLDSPYNESLYQEFEETPLTGWLNPYICT